MNIEFGLDCGTRLIRKVPNIKFNLASAGYVRPNGEICFTTQEAAINYAKNRVVKALNSNKPIERGIIIDGNVIILEVDGTAKSVYFPVNKITGKDIVTVHGHPDAVLVKENHHPCIMRDIIFSPLSYLKGNIKQSGIAYPISLADYRCFMLKPNERKAIVYNSKGEFSMLTKVNSQASMNRQEFEEIVHEYFLTVSNLNSTLSKFKFALKKIFHFFQTSDNAEQSMLCEANKLSNEIHKFLLLNTDKYGVKYETNFSNLIK